MDNTSAFLGRAGQVLAKIIEIGFWIGAVGLLVALVMTLFFPSLIANGTLASVGEGGEQLIIMGIDAGPVTLQTLAKTYSLTAPFGIVTCGLYAMIFRTLYQIMKSLHASKGIPFSAENSPFRAETAIRIRNIGIFSILIPVVTIIGQAVVHLIYPEASADFDFLQLALGLAMLYLSSIFQYGTKLQTEMDEVI